MKKIGILHGELSRCIATMGHMDMILIGDAGMPVPEGVPLIDLAVVKGLPGFLDILNAVLSELCVEAGVISSELGQVSPHMATKLGEAVGDSFELKQISHEELKELSKKAKAVVRTGEFTPYANIILQAGVIF